MNWNVSPLGIISRHDLLNAILAIWKTRYNVSNMSHLDEFAKGYEMGFEESLDAIAQIAGLTEEFEIAKVTHQSKAKLKSTAQSDFVDASATLIES